MSASSLRFTAGFPHRGYQFVDHQPGSGVFPFSLGVPVDLSYDRAPDQPGGDMTGKTEVTITTLATALKTDPRTLRAFLRDQDLGAGRGHRYAWASMTDPAVKAITSAWKAAQASAASSGDADAKGDVGASRGSAQKAS